MTDGVSIMATAGCVGEGELMATTNLAALSTWRHLAIMAREHGDNSWRLSTLMATPEDAGRPATVLVAGLSWTICNVNG